MSDAPLLDWTPPSPLPIGGETFVPERDESRLSAQTKAVHDATLNRGWLTLSQISAHTGAPEASVSARLRDLRKYGFEVSRRYIARGLHEYRVTKP